MHYVQVITRVVTGRGDHRLVYHSPQPLPVGSVVQVPLGQRNSLGLVVGATSKPNYPTKLAKLYLSDAAPVQYVNFVTWLADYYATPAPIVVAQLLATGLQKKRRPMKRPRRPLLARPTRKFRLSPAQQTAVKALSASTSGTAILHGATASGKTLIYRALVKQTLAQGQSVLLLVPEIGLTEQIVSDFSDLAEHIFISHSDLPEAARQEIWLKILQQKPPYIVIGPRSSLLTPLQSIGLIVVDEAQETAYKNDTSPRYQAVSAAAWLAKAHDAKLILGTATPRLSDYYLAKTKRRPIINLPRYGSGDTQITLVDQRQREKFTRSQFIGDRLLLALEQTLLKRRQSLLYLNRRGSASLILCSNCGWSAQCPRCAVTLTLHHDLNVALCHQCGYKQAVPVHCPICGSSEIIFRGVGTKRIERELTKLLPGARLARFDSDSLSGQRLNDLYEAVHEGEIDIVIGTQSVAKGLDLPKLDTVGVVSADSELHLPDFSSAERTFQLLYQVIGRAGRAGGGQAIIQTHHPEHPAISYAIARQYEAFYKQEISSRQQHGYPPFRHLLALIYRASSRARASQAAERLADELKQTFRPIEVLGPAPAYRERQGRYYRWLLIVKSPKRAKLVKIAEATRAKPGWQIDLDPINLLY